ncbi:hypothetical protein [Aquihabitans sp. McL0605]|uniref:hypothetical protein n=1 Tax=Aquihabitans sp. McL0605 TaxID=3415671 RepID=UPI003CF5BDBE
MSHRTRLALVAATIGLLVPAAIASSPAGALDQDLVVSAASGPPGTVITVSSASCAPTDGVFTSMDARLISGTAPDELLAGVGSADGGSVSIVVPDWVDPAQPAVIEATCATYSDIDGQEDQIDYDPVAFDIEPGAGPATQVRTFSRTSLLAGQAFTVTGSGCASVQPDGFALVAIEAGSDLSGRYDRNQDGAGFGFGQIDGSGDFVATVGVGDASAWVSIDVSSSDPTPHIETGEDPLTLEPGTYAAYTYCVGGDGDTLVLEPQTFEVTGVAPTSAIDLTVDAGSSRVTLAGTDCAQGDVETELQAESADDLTAPGADLRSTSARRHDAALRSLGAGAELKPGTVRRTVADGAAAAGSSTRAVPGIDAVEDTVTPDADGAWSTGRPVGFDHGIVWGFATCGDPLADGFFYDPQIVTIDVPEPPVETTTTTTTTAPPPAPANAVPGTPTYAG